MTLITISPGHWKVGTGASDLVDEVTEARKNVSVVVNYLREGGVGVTKVEDDQSSSQSQNLKYLVDAHNQTQRQVDVSVHLNASGSREKRGIGTEVLYYDAKKLADQMSNAIAQAAGFKNRGSKIRKDLAFLSRTDKPAILIEVCFVNSVEDVELYKARFDEICIAIAKVLAQFVNAELVASKTKEQTTFKFSSPTLKEKVEDVLENREKMSWIIEKAISEKVILATWQEKFTKGTMTMDDFLGICVLFAMKEK